VKRASLRGVCVRKSVLPFVISAFAALICVTAVAQPAALVVTPASCAAELEKIGDDRADLFAFVASARRQIACPEQVAAAEKRLKRFPSPPAPIDPPSPPLPQPPPAPLRVERQQDQISPVLVGILTNQPRRPRNGGSAVILLSPRPEDQALNLVVCQTLYNALDMATPEQIERGWRETGEGIEKLRPVYWMLRRPVTQISGIDRCAERISAYDFPRARSVAAKLGVTGPGPFLVVQKADESRAGLVSLAKATPAEVFSTVNWFRDSFAQAETAWDAPQHARAASSVTLTVGGAPIGSMLQLVLGVSAGQCRLGDLTDACMS
jgi:hypothetical protein